MSLRILAVASIATLVAAQGSQTSPYGGFGRYPCNLPGGGADPTQCTAAALAAINPVDTPDPQLAEQGQQPDPVNPVCVQQVNGGFFCGLAGAACTSDANCDNGVCNTAIGQCQGGFGNACNGDDENCLGLLYCTSFDLAPLSTCGQNGAYCGDFSLFNPAITDAEQNVIYNQYCASSYCQTLQREDPNDPQTVNSVSNCAAQGLAGAVCQPDNVNSCTTGLTCDAAVVNGASTFVCTAPVAPPGASALQRSRRSMNSRRNLCPASHTACAVSGAKTGFECIDTSSNLEQCGACSSDGGIDCTTLPGVEAVGCVAGQCEIWSCAEGFAWDVEASACKA